MTTFKTQLAGLLILFMAASCKNSGSSNLLISGTVKNNPVKQVVYLDLVEFDAVAPKTIDTAVLEAGTAKFSLSGIPEENESMYRLRFEKDGVFMLLANDVNDIKIDANWSDFGNYTTNSAASNSFHALLKIFNDKLAVIDTLRQQFLSLGNQKATDSLLTAADSSFRTTVRQTEDYLLKYADTTKSPTIAMYIVGPLLKTQLEPERFEPVMTSMSKRFRDNASVQKIVKDYFDFMQQKSAGDIIGKPAPDFTLPDVNGKPVALSSFRGKYVMVDFWASWCGPCRMENPNIVNAYQKYKDKNFTVLGVSLDKAKEPWVKAIADDKLTWFHVSDLK
jgi:thiol-disulfide isomerase/thioredoxin